MGRYVCSKPPYIFKKRKCNNVFHLKRSVQRYSTKVKKKFEHQYLGNEIRWFCLETTDIIVRSERVKHEGIVQIDLIAVYHLVFRLGKEKLGVPQNENVSLVLESDGTQVEDGEYFKTLTNNTILLLLRHGERWCPTGVDIIRAGIYQKNRIKSQITGLTYTILSLNVYTQLFLVYTKRRGYLKTSNLEKWTWGFCEIVTVGPRLIEFRSRIIRSKYFCHN